MHAIHHRLRIFVRLTTAEYHATEMMRAALCDSIDDRISLAFLSRIPWRCSRCETAGVSVPSIEAWTAKLQDNSSTTKTKFISLFETVFALPSICSKSAVRLRHLTMESSAQRKSFGNDAYLRFESDAPLHTNHWPRPTTKSESSRISTEILIDLLGSSRLLTFVFRRASYV